MFDRRLYEDLRREGVRAIDAFRAAKGDWSALVIDAAERSAADWLSRGSRGMDVDEVIERLSRENGAIMGFPGCLLADPRQF